VSPPVALRASSLPAQRGKLAVKVPLIEKIVNFCVLITPLPQGSLYSQVLVITSGSDFPSEKSMPGILPVPLQLSVQVNVFIGGMASLQFKVWSAPGSVRVGRTLSSILIVCLCVISLPQPSVASQVLISW